MGLALDDDDDGYILRDKGQVRIPYKGHRVKIVVTRAKARKSLFPQCKTSIGINSDSIKDRSVKFADKMGLSATANRVV